MANWDKTIDLKDIWPDARPVDGEEFIKLRDEVVARFRASDWDRVRIATLL